MDSKKIFKRKRILGGLYKWLSTASLENRVMPLYYVSTTRGLSKEVVEAGRAMYMVSLTDSIAKKKYTKVDNVDRVRLGFVEGKPFGTDTLVW